MFFAGLTFALKTLQSVPVLMHFSAFSFPISCSFVTLSRFFFLKQHHLINYLALYTKIFITMKQR